MLPSFDRYPLNDAGAFDVTLSSDEVDMHLHVRFLSDEYDGRLEDLRNLTVNQSRFLTQRVRTNYEQVPVLRRVLALRVTSRTVRLFAELEGFTYEGTMMLEQ